MNEFSNTLEEKKERKRVKWWMKMEIRFKFLYLLRGVSVIAFFPRRVVGGVVFVAGSAVHVVTARSAFMFIFSASSQTVRFGGILGHSIHIFLSIYIGLLLLIHFLQTRKKEKRERNKKTQYNIVPSILFFFFASFKVTRSLTSARDSPGELNMDLAKVGVVVTRRG